MTTVNPTGTQISSLAGKLAKKKPAPRPAPATTPSVPPTETAAPSAAPRKAAAVTETAVSPAEAGYNLAESGHVTAPEKPTKRPLAFQVPLELRDALRAAAATGRTTNADIILEAIEANVTKLPELVAAASTATIRGSLFRREATSRATPRVQVTVRMAQDHIDTIDSLVREVNAPDRTTLLVAALRAHLKA